MKTVAPDVAREIDATVIPLADLDEHMQLLNAGLSEAGVEYDQDVIHAGAAETAMVLAIDEGLVRMDQIERGPEGDISPARLLSEGFRSITENGVLGNPNEATVEAGETIIQKVAETYVKYIETERSSV
ncbi:creatinine amidohydrolase [Natrialba asiatica DSM 12278]|uniref:Creatinine amidohydrolase n=1 Tax=Natrialba asiatica (strain ATCC 700177 / DSM 12278 / JCM 9576 / FERM P-10747 / NBRC 102637 / 172P1) TaxID=29540 RepID=M0B5N0_NATA1|nr:creatinine amidohydrolase [Natrialba asiatica DSM 12278]